MGSRFAVGCGSSGAQDGPAYTVYTVCRKPVVVGAGPLACYHAAANRVPGPHGLKVPFHMIVYPYLDRIASPQDLRGLAARELPRVAEELRRFVLNSVAATGGHL